MFILVPILLTFGNSAIAQNGSASPNSNNPQKAEPNVKQYLTDKYQKIQEVMSSLYQTPNGPQGKLHIRGNFMPKNAPAIGGDRENRSRAIAKAFLEEEATLLGIKDMAELKEVRINTEKGHDGDYINIYYRRYINNLELEKAHLYIIIGPDETINSVSAGLVPVPPELYQAVAKKQLPEEKIREIVKQDLKSSGNIEANNVKIADMAKVAVATAPYLIWKVRVTIKTGTEDWDYKIDALTGEILNKRSALIE